MYTLKNVTYVEPLTIFMVNIRIIFVGPADNATMTLDSAPPLGKSMSRLTPRILCATPSRLSVVDEVDANRSISEPLQPKSAPKRMPSRGRNGAIIPYRRPRSSVSPEAS
jgi:hypothetical protein